MFIHMLELNTTPILTAPVPAATTILLRDTPGGVEVLMLKRAQASAVLGGVYVFPGGKVDAADRAPALLASLEESPESLLARIGNTPVSPEEAAAFFVAARRETREECGVDVSIRDLVSWSRWTTPVLASFMKKRFDTQFFVTEMPSGQAALHDDHEAVASNWFAPREALQRYWQGEIEMAPVQVMSLIDLSRFSSVDHALTVGRSRPAPHVLPEPFQDGETRVLTYPGDPMHSVPVRALPGPLRLRNANQRFEPVEGHFEAFFVDLG